jgi:hypothetical protein
VGVGVVAVAAGAVGGGLLGGVPGGPVHDRGVDRFR